MEAVRAFNNELSQLYEAKPPVSRAKMAQITKGAMKAIKFYKHVVQSVEKFIQKCRPEYKVPGLYVIDSIVRQSRHQFGADKDVFAARFCKNITTTFQHLFKCPPEEKSKIVRVLNLWQKNSVLPIEIIQPLQDLAADPTNTQAILSVQRAAEAFINSKSETPVKKAAPPQKEVSSTKPAEPAAQALTDVAKTVTQLLQQNQPSTLSAQQQQLSQLQLLQQQLLQHTQTMQDPAVQQQPVIDSTLLSQIQTLTDQLITKTGQTDQAAAPPTGFNKKLLDFDYGESDDEDDKRTPQQHAGGVQGLLNDPGLMQQIQQMSQTIQKTEQLKNELNAQEQIRQKLLEQQQAEFQQQIGQTIDLPPSNPPEEKMNEPSDGEREHSRDRSHRDRKHRSRSRSRDRSRKKHKRSRSRSRSRKHSRERKSRRSRSRDKDRDREKERDRRKQGLPPMKNGYLSVCSLTLWIGHLNRMTSEHDLAKELEKYGPIKTINIIPPRGCAFVGMAKRKDASRALDKLKRGVKLQGNELKVAWATGAGVKEKKFKDWWDVDLGVTYIPHKKIEDDLNELSEGGMIDEDTVPEHLKASRVIVIDDDEDATMDSSLSTSVTTEPPAPPPTSQPAFNQPPLPGMMPMMPAGMPQGAMGMMAPFLMGQPMPGMAMGQGGPPPGFAQLMRGQPAMMPGAPPPPMGPGNPPAPKQPNTTQTSAPPPQPPPPSSGGPVMMMPSTSQNTQLAQAIENIMSNSAAISAVAAQGTMGMMRPGMMAMRPGMMPSMRAQFDMSRPPPPQARMNLMQQQQQQQPPQPGMVSMAQPRPGMPTIGQMRPGMTSAGQNEPKMMPIKLAGDWSSKLNAGANDTPDVEMKDNLPQQQQQQQPPFPKPQGGAGILGGPPMQFMGRGFPPQGMGGPRGPGDMQRFPGGPRGPMDMFQRMPNFMGRGFPPGFQPGQQRPGGFPGGMPPMPGQQNPRMPGQGPQMRPGMPGQGPPTNSNDPFGNRPPPPPQRDNFQGHGGIRPPWGPNRNEQDRDEREIRMTHDHDERRGDRDDRAGRGRGDRDDRGERDRRAEREFRGDRDERRGDKDDREDRRDRMRQDSGHDRFNRNNDNPQERKGGRRSRWGDNPDEGNPNRIPINFDKTKMAGSSENKGDLSKLLASWSAKHIRNEGEQPEGVGQIIPPSGPPPAAIPSLFDDIPAPVSQVVTSHQEAPRVQHSDTNTGPDNSVVPPSEPVVVSPPVIENKAEPPTVQAVSEPAGGDQQEVIKEQSVEPPKIEQPISEPVSEINVNNSHNGSTQDQEIVKDIPSKDSVVIETSAPIGREEPSVPEQQPDVSNDKEAEGNGGDVDMFA